MSLVLPSVIFATLVVGALISAAVGAAALIVLLIRDLRRKSTW